MIQRRLPWLLLQEQAQLALEGQLTNTHQRQPQHPPAKA